jgi:small-conductance mechanosensitive channel
MQNLSLLAGALGVGIGFGLQNIVNNVISGLILAFERPVTVGDIIEVTGNEGVVQKIGIRASVIKQYDGSEVIVPNAELISSKVINWTLSKYTRRLTMTIHTHKETATDKVLKLMKEAVSRVEFALYYWASRNILDCKSLETRKCKRHL